MISSVKAKLTHIALKCSGVSDNDLSLMAVVRDLKQNLVKTETLLDQFEVFCHKPNMEKDEDAKAWTEEMITNLVHVLKKWVEKCNEIRRLTENGAIIEDLSTIAYRAGQCYGRLMIIRKKNGFEIKTPDAAKRNANPFIPEKIVAAIPYTSNHRIECPFCKTANPNSPTIIFCCGCGAPLPKESLL